MKFNQALIVSSSIAFIYGQGKSVTPLVPAVQGPVHFNSRGTNEFGSELNSKIEAAKESHKSKQSSKDSDKQSFSNITINNNAALKSNKKESLVSNKGKDAVADYLIHILTNTRTRGDSEDYVERIIQAGNPDFIPKETPINALDMAITALVATNNVTRYVDNVKEDILKSNFIATMFKAFGPSNMDNSDLFKKTTNNTKR